MRADEFKDAFLETWNELMENAEWRDRVIAAWQEPATWTTFMLGDIGDEEPDSFLHSVGARLERSVYREYFKLDCVFYQENPNLIGDSDYSAGFDAIIEHENGDRPEEEWWKLLMWRAPLKVLIFYDYTDDEIQHNINMARWLSGKLEKFAEMTQQMHYRWPGRKDEDDYLIVVGYRPIGEQVPCWRLVVNLSELHIPQSARQGATELNTDS